MIQNLESRIFKKRFLDISWTIFFIIPDETPGRMFEPFLGGTPEELTNGIA